MQGRPAIKSAFSGGAGAAALLLLVWCAPAAGAANIESHCDHQRVERPESLEVDSDDLDTSLAESRVAGVHENRLDPLPSDIERVPPSPEFEAIMMRILDASVGDGTDRERAAESGTDAMPVAEADADREGTDSARTGPAWASDAARLPGLSDAASERYRRQMYRTDI